MGIWSYYKLHRTKRSRNKDGKSLEIDIETSLTYFRALPQPSSPGTLFFFRLQKSLEICYETFFFLLSHTNVWKRYQKLLLVIRSITAIRVYSLITQGPVIIYRLGVFGGFFLDAVKFNRFPLHYHNLFLISPHR